MPGLEKTFYPFPMLDRNSAVFSANTLEYKGRRKKKRTKESILPETCTSKQDNHSANKLLHWNLTICRLHSTCWYLGFRQQQRRFRESRWHSRGVHLFLKIIFKQLTFKKIAWHIGFPSHRAVFNSWPARAWDWNFTEGGMIKLKNIMSFLFLSKTCAKVFTCHGRISVNIILCSFRFVFLAPIPKVL